MKRHTETEDIRHIPLAAMFTALGVLIPQLFHLLGLGATFLPMFLPILAGSMLLPWRLTVITALLAPIMSWLLTGMPPLSPPILPILLIELICTAAIASWLRRSLGLPVLISLLIALTIDRAILLGMIHVLTGLLGVQHPLIGPAVVAVGIPGIIMMLVVIPPATAFLEHQYPRFVPLVLRAK